MKVILLITSHEFGDEIVMLLIGLDYLCLRIF